MNEQTLDQELQYEIEHKDFVQDIVDKVYPHIATKLGPSDYFDEIPPVELWQDIYARLSGIPGSMGEESESSKAQFDENTNKIFIYYPNMADEEDVIKSLLHEYTHHLQDPEKWEEYRAEGYDNNPYETASRKAEENWKDYVIYLQDNPPVNIGDTVKITETKLESNGDLLNEILLVIGFEDDGTPVTVNESDTLLEGVTTHPITINLLESEFSWFKDKSGTDKKTKGIEPDWSIRRGRQHYAMNVEDTPNEPVTAFNTYLVKNSPFNYMGFDYYLTAVPDNMPHSARIDVFVPMLDTGYNADKLWSGERIRYYEDLGIDDFDYDYEEEEASPYIMQNPILHDIGYNTKWGEHYDYDERFRDGHPEETLKYDNRESDYLNYPGALYNRSWMERYSDLKNEMDELGKLFGIEGILINRYPDRPWMRQEDSYGNQNIRPGKDVPRKLNEAVATQDLIKKFLKDFWPKHRSQLYRDLYKTYHPSTYVESFNRPSSNFEDALEIVADAVHEGKKLGLIDSSVDWSDIYNYEDSDGYSNPDQEKRLIDDDGIPTLNDQLEIMDNTNLDWVHGILLFDVLEEIVDEFKHYCGENGIDESGMGKCMDEFPPSPNTGSQPKPYAGGTLKQDYYTLYNFMRELERAGIPVTDYLKDPTYPNIIKLVDDGTTDYNEEGGERTSEDWDNTRTQIEFEMDAPDRLDEAFYEDEEGNEAVDPQFLRLMSNVKKLMEYETYDSFERVLIKYFGYNWPETTAKIWLILKHNMEVVYPGTTLEELLNNKKLILKFPRFYEYWVKYKDSYSSHQREEECDSEGFGEESGEDCECDKAIKYVKSEDGYEEEEDCTDDWNDGEKGEDCECEEFAYKDVEVYYYPLIEVQILSTIDAEEMLGYNADYQEFEDFLEDRFVKLSEDTDDYELEEDAQTWDYFGDNEEGEIYESGVDEEGDGAWYINSFMREILGKDESTGISEQYQHTTPLKNQTDGQLNLFPTGTWEFPVGWDEESIESVTEGVPEKAITYIFKQWDEEGINFRDLKLLGIRANSDIAVFLLKRYLQNTTKPVIASHVFACDDLANLFDDTNRDYDLSYIKEFLCGDDSFWDSQDWYNYEWDEYMTDQIDENNWKTISEIFGGVSQSDAEDILNRSSSSEEVDELTEKYDEEIDEIRTFIVWAHNDEHEWAVKDGMRKDILDKLADHFGADGEIYRSDEDGSYSWHFEDDLRSWVNDGDTWDNIERFNFHPDYAGTTLEDSLIDISPGYLNEKTIFAALIDEEYMFHDYCEGKKGECLQVDTKFFDGYWHPDYDINSSLEDRLGELTYEPEQINEQEKKLRTKTIYEDDNWKYIWPVDDYSFCQLAGDTDWCKNGEKYFEGYGTSYILQDKNTNEKFWFTDKEKIPGLPSGDVSIKDSASGWKNVHRFLSDKPSLHDMFLQEYSTFDLMKYGIKLDPNILEDFSKTNKFAEVVYRMIQTPSSEIEEELSTDEFMGDKFEPDNNQRYGAFINTVQFTENGVSLYYEDSIFKEKIMGVYDDDEWYFDMASDRYYDDHCEEIEDEELQYVGYHTNAENREKLDSLMKLFGKVPAVSSDSAEQYDWINDEGLLDDTMEEIAPSIWRNNNYELLDAIGCSVGRARIEAAREELDSEKVLDYSYEGGTPILWKLDITYTQLLYIIGEEKIDTFSELENIEINHIDSGLNETWYDAWDMDEEGLSDFNYALNNIIDEINKYVGGDAETILKNRERYEKILKDLGFEKRYSNSNFERVVGDVDQKLTGDTKRITIMSYDPKIDEVDISITGNFQGKRHQIPLDQLSDYVVSKELFESIVE